MSTIEVDKVIPQSGTALQVGESGDTITVPAGATLDASNATTTLPANVVTTDGTQTLTNKSIVATQLTGTVDNARLTGSGSITINGSSVSLGGSTTIETGTSWQSSIKTANFTAVSGEGYWINTTSAAITVTLPVSASVGDTIEFSDYSRTWGTNAVTLNLNSLKFQGGTRNPVYNTNGESVKIIYSGTTKGWIPSSDDDVSDEIFSGATEYLVVAGGGSGGNGNGGGGGAGGLLTNFGGTAINLTQGQSYTVTIGAGGASKTSSGTGNNGSNSVLSGSGITTITSIGGGAGGGASAAANDGGSGGGEYYTGSPGAGSGTSGQGDRKSVV